MKAETGLEINALGQMESIALAIAALIRQESEAGRLISGAGILHRLADQDRCPLQAEGFGSLLKIVLDGNEDLHEIPAVDGSRYCYSSLCMTGVYAAILLQKQGDPLRLIVETVRQNSADYTRPVPLDIFTQSPFDLTQQGVLNDLERLEAMEEFCDIARTTTSASSVFLYSILYLEPGHACMLAEWLDVGQFDNP
jgi:hypothetical protein